MKQLITNYIIKLLFTFISVRDWICDHLLFVAVSILSILSPIKPLMLVVGLLIAVDFIFGITRSVKLYGYQSVTSRKMSKTISKMLLYNITIISLFAFETYIMQTGIPLAKTAATFIGLIEIKSCDESFKSIFGWSLWDKMMTLITRGTSETKDIIDEVNKDK